MPKGVEHIKEQKTPPLDETAYFPVMPKGVEHRLERGQLEDDEERIFL